ncbi:hypothetical protein AAMO2058_000697000 [Amorphochlora amoebiformis]|mmetsp:Transcript_33471/g.53826  ORF Transcript_33471/g.53826 Transcript_33471/m.53826 type:complete len:903 (-) Transcript_33471:262-2970(-)
MNGIFEVVVHFSKFKNIDLFRQGLYCIRATLHSQKPDDEKRLPVGEGMPYYLLTEKKVHQRISQNKKIVYPSKISDSLRAFYSKTFRVQYVDQEVELEDACLFRFERSAKQHADTCHLALELLFAEYNSTDYAMRKEYPPQDDFEMVSLKWFTINKFHTGQGSGFYPSTFDDSHFCLLDVMIHFMLIDYQFRQTTVTWKPPPGSQKQQVYELTCKTFENSLFPKNMLRPNGNAYTEREVRSIADKNHLNYVTRLISAYNSLARVAHTLEPSAATPLEIPKAMLRDKPPPPRTTPPAEAKKLGKPLPEIKITDPKKRFAFPPLSRFSRRITIKEGEEKDKKICALVTLMLTKDIKAIAEQNFQLWNTFIRMIPSRAAIIRESLHQEYLTLLHERITCFVFREKFAHKDRWRCAPKDLFNQHARQASQVRRAWGQAEMAKLVLEDATIFAEPEDHVVLFEESYDQSNPTTEYKSRISTLKISNNHFSTSPKGSAQSRRQNRDYTAHSSAKADSIPSSVSRPNPSFSSPPNSTTKSLLTSAEPPLTSTLLSTPSASPPSSIRKNPSGSPRQDSRPRSAAISRGQGSPASKETRNKKDGGRGEDDKMNGANRRRRGSMKMSELAKAVAAAQADEDEDEVGEEAKHIIVFVHGYQGNSWDMRLFKNHLALIFPDHLFLLSGSNEGHTEGDIADMGQRLAVEIVEFIVENCPLGFSKLSFVAHSLGGLITRAALARKEMEPYLSQLHTFMSLASPHCGYMYSKNTVLDTGIWVLKKWSKSLCLTQLSMTDHPNHEDCFVFKLSQKKGLEYFKHCLLLASHQDFYAPFHSSRIELHHDALRNQKNGKVFTSMVQNLLKPLKRPIKRYNVSFVNKKTNLDSIIGRTAHILFLDNHLYMVMICHIYRHLFD